MRSGMIRKRIALAQAGKEAGQYKDIFSYLTKKGNGRYMPKMFA